MIRAIRKVLKSHFFSFVFLIKIFFYFFAQTFLNFFGMLPYSRGAFLFFFNFFFQKTTFFFLNKSLCFFALFFHFIRKLKFLIIPFSFLFHSKKNAWMHHFIPFLFFIRICLLFSFFFYFSYGFSSFLFYKYKVFLLKSIFYDIFSYSCYSNNYYF